MMLNQNEISAENQRFETSSTQNRKGALIEEEKSFPFLKILASVLSLLGLALYWFQKENSEPLL